MKVSESSGVGIEYDIKIGEPHQGECHVATQSTEGSHHQFLSEIDVAAAASLRVNGFELGLAGID